MSREREGDMTEMCEQGVSSPPGDGARGRASGAVVSGNILILIADKPIFITSVVL